MKNLKHTQGEWKALGESYGNYISVGTDKQTVCRVPWGKEDTEYDNANAKLIAEAGTVTNESGLMPRELLVQRNDLLEASLKIDKYLDRFIEIYGLDKLNINAGMVDGILKMRKAIKKATK